MYFFVVFRIIRRMLLFDAHCHLFEKDKVSPKIAAIVNATRPAEWGAVVNIAGACENVWGAVGVHPWFVNELYDGWDMDLQRLLQDNSGIMVGEIGLDKNGPDMDRQIDVFGRQMQIATDLKRGVHVHCVGAWDKMMRVLKCFSQRRPPFILFHRFSGNWGDVARMVGEYNAYFSFRDVSAVVAHIPHDRILIETDSDDVMKIVDVEKKFATVCCGCNFYENTIRMLKNG